MDNQTNSQNSQIWTNDLVSQMDGLDTLTYAKDM